MNATANGDVVIELQGEQLTLMPERALWWMRTSTLLIADLHFGKAATFRASGIPVPSGTTHEALLRLRRIAARSNARRIIFLGDLLHAKAGRSDGMLEALLKWRAEHSELEVLLVRGNHDRSAGDPPVNLDVTCVDAPFLIEPFAMCHHPVKHADGYVIAGHVHPGIRIYGAGGQRERLPCFVVGATCAILPAFGDFTGLAYTEAEEGNEIYAVAEDEVIRISS